MTKKKYKFDIEIYFKAFGFVAFFAMAIWFGYEIYQNPKNVAQLPFRIAVLYIIGYTTAMKIRQKEKKMERKKIIEEIAQRYLDSKEKEKAESVSISENTTINQLNHRDIMKKETFSFGAGVIIKVFAFMGILALMVWLTNYVYQDPRNAAVFPFLAVVGFGLYFIFEKKIRKTTLKEENEKEIEEIVQKYLDRKEDEKIMQEYEAKKAKSEQIIF